MTPHEHVQAKERVLNPVVVRAIAAGSEEVSSRPPTIRESFLYGAMGIDPKHVVIGYAFSLDGEITTARCTGLLGDRDARSHLALRTKGHPEQLIGPIQVLFASDQALRRTGGFRPFFA